MGHLNFGEYSVGTHFYLIVFIQSVPGFEEDICEALSQSFGSEATHFYFSFSEFDIVMVRRLDNDGELELPTSFSHPRIRDFQQVICYAHHETDYEFIADSALTITLLKFDEYHATLKGIGIEKASFDLVKPIAEQAKGTGIRSILLGTLGWPEAIYIQTGQNLQHLLMSIAKIAANGNEIDHLQISHTIPCVKKDLSQATRKLNAEPVFGEIENWRIVASCYPHAVFKIAKGLHKRHSTSNGEKLLNITATFGRRDILIQPNIGKERSFTNINHLLDVLSTLRTDFSDEVISTRTDLGISIDEQELVNTPNVLESVHYDRSKMDRKIVAEFERLQDRVRRFAEWEADRDNLTLKQTGQLYQAVSRLQAIAATPGMESVVNDMLEFVSALVRKALSQVKRIPPVLVSEYNRRKYLELEDMENVFLFGLEQRMAGARLGLGHPSQAYSNLQGLGIQRILRASRAIPFGLLNSVNSTVAEKWWGFTVFGFRNDTFTLPSGVINLPYQDMLHPEDWWRLGHESAHAFGMITELLDNPILRDSIKRLDKKVVWEYVGRDSDLIIDEMAVGVFEYLYCYRGNFELYLRTTWRFLDSLLEGVHSLERLKEYILRTAFVFFFHLQINQAIKPRENVDDVIRRGALRETLFDGEISRALKERAFREEQSIENIIAHSILDRIDNQHLLKRIGSSLHQVNLSDVAAAYRSIEIFRSDLADLFETYQESFRDPRKGLGRYLLPNLEDTLSEIASRLEDGEIVSNLEYVDVFLIPLSLQYRKNEEDLAISQRARIAAILSLWHADRKWHQGQIASVLTQDS